MFTIYFALVQSKTDINVYFGLGKAIEHDWSE